MLTEPRDLAADAVLAGVRAGWDPAVTWAEHVPVGAKAFHWRVGTPSGTRWFATADRVADPDDARRRERAYTAAARLSSLLDFVAGPVPGPEGAVATRLGRYLLTVAPCLDAAPVGDPVTGDFPDDAARADVCSMLARLHTSRRQAGIPLWEPRVGWRGTAQRARLDTLRGAVPWDSGPFGTPAWRVVTGAAPLLDRSLRRLDLLAGAAGGTASAWVPTHGAPHAANVLATAGGLRLGDWETLAVAPTERDLRHVLPEAEGDDPALAYLASGGAPRALSQDLLELFALEGQLAEAADAAVALAGPHDGTADDERALERLDAALAALSRWG